MSIKDIFNQQKLKNIMKIAMNTLKTSHHKPQMKMRKNVTKYIKEEKIINKKNPKN